VLIEISLFSLRRIAPDRSIPNCRYAAFYFLAKLSQIDFCSGAVSARQLSRLDLADSLLDLRHAPIDGEIHAGDKRTFIGGEEHDCGRDFLGLAPAAHWDLRSKLGCRLLGLFSGEASRRR
jgi:hypothetical protein